MLGRACNSLLHRPVLINRTVVTDANKRPLPNKFWQKPGGVRYRGEKDGHGPDTQRIRISKTLRWLLGHGAESEGIFIRADGYAQVRQLLSHPELRNVDFQMLQDVVRMDSKGRYHTYRDNDSNMWICATDRHSIQNIEIDLKRLTIDNIPKAIIHGTSEEVWNLISTTGISKMGRDHIHLAQDLSSDGVLNGVRESSRVLIYVDVKKAMSGDISFYLSRNGVVLTPGNELGLLEPRYFEKVVRISRSSRVVWERPPHETAATETLARDNCTSDEQELLGQTETETEKEEI